MESNAIANLISLGYPHTNMHNTTCHQKILKHPQSRWFFSCSLFYFFIIGSTGFELRPLSSCWASNLPLEPLSPVLFALVIFQVGSHFFGGGPEGIARSNLRPGSSYVYLHHSWDYRHELCTQLVLFFKMLLLLQKCSFKLFEKRLPYPWWCFPCWIEWGSQK
jgi:hypothetical protein